MYKLGVNDFCPYRTPRVSRLKAPSLQQLRRYMIVRSLFKPTSLLRAIARLGFVQADPMRAPARAQDLILAHRVKDYRAGELEHRYPVSCLARPWPCCIRAARRAPGTPGTPRCRRAPRRC